MFSFPKGLFRVWFYFKNSTVRRIPAGLVNAMKWGDHKARPWVRESRLMIAGSSAEDIFAILTGVSVGVPIMNH